ncbi:MAG: polysaccharide lyase 8 family protein [Sedimentisphaerales bacterium]|nr:polysaccharide lyase 8 family protein [Sedimentisphaerales bacterium]
MFRTMILGWLVLLMGNMGYVRAEGVDITRLKQQIIEDILQTIPETSSVRTLMAEMKDDGSWADIDYANRRRANWPVNRHLEQVVELAKAWHGPHELAGDNQLKSKIMDGLDFWLKHDLQCPNWFSNQITVPRNLATVLLLMDEEITPAQLDKSVEILKRAQIRATGQNRVWLSSVCVMRGCLQEDEDLVSQAIKAITDTIKVSESEGLQADMSFWQHGRCFYSGGYGLPFTEDSVRWAVITRNTKWAFTKETIYLLSSYILDGQQWVLRGICFDPTARGRGITLSDRQGYARLLARPCRDMAMLHTPRQDEFLRMARWVSEEDKVYHGPVGNRHFWRSDIMAHQRPGFYASAKMYSTRVVNTDSLINGEGVLSHYIADGSSFLMRTGREYYDICGVWDWRRPPGVTVELKGFDGPPRREGNRDFVGGVSDGMYGAAAFDFERDGLAARKAWFFFDDEVVYLGAGINCPGDYQVITSVNQCRLKGDVFAGCGDAIDKLGCGLHENITYDWVWHDGMGYLPLGDNSVTVKNDAQSGNWHAINTNEEDRVISGDVFSVWLNHGVKPENAQYSYMVCPDMTVKQMKDYAAKPHVRILANSTTQQVVRHEGLHITAAVCYQPGKVNCGDFSIEAKMPCLILVRTCPQNLQLAVSDPTARLNKLVFNIDRKLSGDKIYWNEKERLGSITIELPQKLYAGQTVSKEYIFPNK